MNLKDQVLADFILFCVDSIFRYFKGNIATFCKVSTDGWLFPFSSIAISTDYLLIKVTDYVNTNPTKFFSVTVFLWFRIMKYLMNNKNKNKNIKRCIFLFSSGDAKVFKSLDYQKMLIESTRPLMAKSH